MQSIHRNFSINIEALISYSDLKLWSPTASSDQVRRFLTELVSSDEMILDLFDRDGRIAAAVLLDLVANPANDACLEILGIRPNIDLKIVLGAIVSHVLNIAPKRRSGFQVGIPATAAEAEQVLRQLGLKAHYETYEMTRDLTTSISVASNTITPASEENADSVYSVLCEAFANSPDASIPEIAKWKANFLRSSFSRFYVYRDQTQIVGFANLVEHPEQATTEIRTVGVADKYRGKGIGQMLITTCLAESVRMGAKTCWLSVSLQNPSALGLYLKNGFKVTDRYLCLRSDFKPS